MTPRGENNSLISWPVMAQVGSNDEKKLEVDNLLGLSQCSRFWKGCRSRGFWVKPELYFLSKAPTPTHLLFLQKPKIILTLIVCYFFKELKVTDLKSNRPKK